MFILELKLAVWKFHFHLWGKNTLKGDEKLNYTT